MDLTTLYGGPLEDFVARRNELVKQLRSGDPAAAATAGKLRKPSVSAWAIDVVARAEPGLIAELLAAGADAGEAQRAVSSGAGSSEALMAASARVRTSIEAAARAATAALEGAGHATGEATARRIRTTLQAAVSGGAAERAALWRGTLDRDLEPAGFGAAEAVDADVPELAAVLAPLRQRVARANAGAARARARSGDPAVSRAAERAAVEQEGIAARARRTAGVKRQNADRLAGEAERAESDAAAAEKEAEAAERAAAVARTAADEAKRG